MNAQFHVLWHSFRKFVRAVRARRQQTKRSAFAHTHTQTFTLAHSSFGMLSFSPNEICALSNWEYSSGNGLMQHVILGMRIIAVRTFFFLNCCTYVQTYTIQSATSRAVFTRHIQTHTIVHTLFMRTGDASQTQLIAYSTIPSGLSCSAHHDQQKQNAKPIEFL